MANLYCAECGSEMETAEIRQPIGERTVQRERTFCPECKPPDNGIVDRSPVSFPPD